jgi:hypothetical protein
MINKIQKQIIKLFKVKEGFSTLWKVPKNNFCEKLKLKLNNTLKNEITDEEKHYTPLNKEDQDNYLTKTRFVFFEKEDKINMELRKSVDEFDVTVKFSSQVPNGIK